MNAFFHPYSVDKAYAASRALDPYLDAAYFLRKSNEYALELEAELVTGGDARVTRSWLRRMLLALWFKRRIATLPKARFQ